MTSAGTWFSIGNDGAIFIFDRADDERNRAAFGKGVCPSVSLTSLSTFVSNIRAY